MSGYPIRYINFPYTVPSLSDRTVHISIDGRDKVAVTLLEKMGATSDRTPHTWKLDLPMHFHGAIANTLDTLFAHGFAWEIDRYKDNPLEDIGPIIEWYPGLRDTFPLAFKSVDSRARHDAAHTNAAVARGWHLDPTSATYRHGHWHVNVVRGEVLPPLSPGDKGWTKEFSATGLVTYKNTSAPSSSSSVAHRISWENGRLSFADHFGAPDNTRARTLDAVMGVPPCGCAEFLKDWRTKDHWTGMSNPVNLDNELLEGLRLCAAATEARREYNENLKSDPLQDEEGNSRLVERAAERSLTLVERNVMYTNYRVVEAIHNNKHLSPYDDAHRYIPQKFTVGNEPSIECGGAGQTFAVTVKPTWWSHVGSRGFSVIDGSFVVDVLESDEHGYPVRVVAGRAGGGHVIRTHTATVKTGKDGSWVIKWDE